MARLTRLAVPGHPHHIFQRGNNRQAIFSTATDRQIFLNLLHEACSKFTVALHGYVLMDNHFHLLATPESSDSLPRLMQALGRGYVRHYNHSQGRSGTLWEGRYRSALMQSGNYLFACMVYIDLNPVRSGLVLHAHDYAWSSHGHYAGLRVDKSISAHPLIWALGNTPFARESRYRELVQTGISMHQQMALTRSVLSGWALGDNDFLQTLQITTDRRLTRALPGRPRRAYVAPAK
jgi:putative transposase